MRPLKLFFFVSLSIGLNKTFAQEMKGLPENASEKVKKWAIQFDFDDDSCYPAPAISPYGKTNPGLKATGTRTGDCRDLEQLKNSNTYVRSHSVIKNGHTYEIIMYALYFEKDQYSPWTAVELKWSHRHDWEWACVWLKDGRLTHASYSAHGSDGETKPISSLTDIVSNNHLRIVYHQHNVRTHAMRFAQTEEKIVGWTSDVVKKSPIYKEVIESPENDLKKWLTPKLVQWDRLTLKQRELLAQDWGSANPPFIAANFFDEIRNYKPESYPSVSEWKRSKNFLLSGERLNSGEKLFSSNGAYMLRMQEDDGNLCVYKSNNGTQGTFVWGSYQSKKYDLGASHYLSMQNDGNLCIYDKTNRFKWGSSQVKPYSTTEGSKLVLTDTGKLNILNSKGQVVWKND
ncbi:MAG: NPP1 family protein [Bacteroidota bacterium]